MFYSVTKKTIPSNNKLNSPEVKQKLKESFAALNEEKDKKRAVIRELFAGDPKMIEGKEIGMRKTMNEERVKEHEKEIEKIYWEDFFIKRIEKNPNIIRNLKNPSEKVQLVAVQQDWSAIEDIKNPAVKVLELALEKKKREWEKKEK